ncbi:3-oxoacyl-reductase [Camillea tinctor]|nr:3-oxoacyl-reductase [Camillea tinctor]
MSSATPHTLAGKVAVVSGSSAGIGASIAKELSKRGASVVVNYPFASEEADAKAVLESIHSSGDGDNRRSIAVEADLSTIDGPKKLAAAASETFGRVDILVNNAGYSFICDIAEMSEADLERAWDRIVNLNGRGTMFLTRAIVPLLPSSSSSSSSPAEKGSVRSRIVNIGSSTSRDPDPDMTIYAGSKGMVESFTRCWARDFPRRYGCTVNTVAPGPVATDSFLAAPEELLNHVRAKFDRVPVASRFARPEEIAWVVAELCEERAGWLNGLYIPVTGGATLL